MITHCRNGDVEFRFFRPNAQRVCLVGDFNGWRRSEAAMRKRGDGWWTCRLHLRPGAYQFQYLADGERYLDFAAFGVERGPLGGWNSVVVVWPANESENAQAAGGVAMDHRGGERSKVRCVSGNRQGG